jgi:nicotinate phosphoribosyltransferase
VRPREPWIDSENVALLTDLYELTMLQAFFDARMYETAVFDLFIRRLPPNRDYLVACGLEDVLQYLENLHFSSDSLAYLQSLGTFSQPFLNYLRSFRFSGDVFAVPEGTVVFANEPILEVVAPLPESQLVETYVMNQIHLQTLAASKAVRVVSAAAGRPVIDFGLRRAHGAEAGLKAARAFFIAGVEATSDVLAGHMYGIPVAGTMAHSYVQAHDTEMEAFSAFVKSFPTTILLVDTYDTLQGVRHVIELKRRLGDEFRVHGIRLDSGDLAALSRQARHLLDEAGLQSLQIVASSSLDEYAIDDLVASAAPIDSFGVGTKMAVSSDAPYLDTAYKLVEYAGRPRMKKSEAKSNLPGRKQIFRQESQDVVGLFEEPINGDPLLVKVMEGGKRLTSSVQTLEACRATLRQNQRRMQSQTLPYRVAVSPAVQALMSVS